ncbi:MAG TPA: hypothetical protein VEB64_11505 [Azospirillaceae bacterium]|nr:hypothetical protein [Azospirillaceae bacterium]
MTYFLHKSIRGSRHVAAALALVALGACAAVPPGPPSANRWSAMAVESLPVTVPSAPPLKALLARAGAQADNYGWYEVVLSNDTALPGSNVLTIKPAAKLAPLDAGTLAAAFPGAITPGEVRRADNRNGPLMVGEVRYTSSTCVLMSQESPRGLGLVLRACGADRDQAAMLAWFEGLAPRAIAP